MPVDPLIPLLTTMRKMRFWSHRYAAVWFDPMPKQRAFLETKCKERWLSGGVRSGKSECGAVELALRAWGVKGLLYKGFPRDGKARAFWAVALSADKQRDTLRKKLSKMLGPKAHWREAEHTYVLPNGSTIELKTQESDADKFQSVDIDGAWLDEIGRDEERYNHILDRLIDRKGDVWTTFAPTRGMGWYYQKFEAWQEATNGLEIPAADVLFLRLFTEDNRYLPKTEVAWRKSAMSSDTELRVKFYGEMVELRGLVYPTFDPPRHVIKCLVNGKCSIPPSPGWLIIRGHDYGNRSPSACAWLGIDPREKTITAFREMYERGLSVPQVAFRVKQLSPLEEKVILDVADPSLWNKEPTQNAIGRFIRLKDMYHEHGVPIAPANNEWQMGVELVTQLFGPRGSPPVLRIHECCRNGIKEIRRHHWPEGGADVPGAAAAMGDDHFLDALRYGAVAAKPYLDGSEPTGGFIERKEDDSGFDGGKDAAPGGGVCVPQVRMVKVLDDKGREVSHHYVRVWSAEAAAPDDGFDL